MRQTWFCQPLSTLGSHSNGIQRQNQAKQMTAGWQTKWQIALLPEHALGFQC